MKKQINTLCFLLVFSLLLTTPLLPAKKKSHISLFAHSGITWTSYPAWFSNLYNSPANIGIGIEKTITHKLSLRASFNYCRFKLENDYANIMYFGDLILNYPGKGIYIGYYFYEPYDLSADVKFVFLKKKSASFYLTAGSGYSIVRYVSGAYHGYDGRIVFVNLAGGMLLSAGFGLDLPVSKELSFFIESAYVLHFFKNHEDQRNLFPLKIGFKYQL